MEIRIYNSIETTSKVAFWSKFSHIISSEAKNHSLEISFVDKMHNADCVLCRADTECKNLKNDRFRDIIPIPVLFDDEKPCAQFSKYNCPQFCTKELARDPNKYAKNLSSIVLFEIGVIHQRKRVFISYKRGESDELALYLYKTLASEEYDFEVFLDTRKIDVGAIFMNEIRVSIAESDVFLLLFSSKYMKSPYTTKEFFAALSSHTGVIVIHKEDQKENIPQGFETISYNEIHRSLLQSLLDKIELVRGKFIVNKKERINQALKQLGVEPQTLWTYGDDNIYCPIYGVPSSFDIYNRQRTVNRLHKESSTVEKSNSFTILYDHWILPSDYNKHIRWIIQNKSINTMTIKEVNKNNITSNSPCPVVFLSASLASDERSDQKVDYDYAKVHEIVFTIVEEVINRNGILVFGGHPTITPMIANMISLHKEETGEYPKIYLYQSKYFKDNYPIEVKEFPSKNLEETECENMYESEKNKQESLRIMRERMLEEKGPFTHAFFIGGRIIIKGKTTSCGVWDEYKLFVEKYSTAKACVFTKDTGTSIEEMIEYAKKRGARSEKLLRIEDIKEIHNCFA